MTTSHHICHVLAGSSLLCVTGAVETLAEMLLPDHLILEQHPNKPMAESWLHCMTQAVLG